MLFVALFRKQNARLQAILQSSNLVHGHHDSSTPPHMESDVDDSVRARPVLRASAVTFSDPPPPASLSIPESSSRAALLSALPPITILEECGSDASRIYASRRGSALADPSASFVAPRPTLQPSTQDLGETMLRSHIAVLEKEVARLREQQVVYDYLEDAPPPLYREAVRSGQ